MKIIQIKRGTRAQIEAAKLNGELLPGEPYLITDENRIGVGTSANAYSAFVKEEENFDEKVAVTSDGEPGYIYGTNGTNGVIRSNGSITMTKDITNSYVSLDVSGVDGGTF